jgi:exopolysaccharide production protein ExoZ
VVFAIGAIVLLLFAATGRDYGYVPSGSHHVPRMMIVYGEITLPRWIAWGIPALILVTIACRLESCIRWPFAFLGKYTYSVYLCHGIVIGTMLTISTRLGIESTAWTLLLLPVMLVVAVGASYRLIELPMIYLGKRLTDRYRSFRATS